MTNEFGNVGGYGNILEKISDRKVYCPIKTVRDMV